MKKSVNRRSFMKIAGSSLGIGVLYTALPMPVAGEAIFLEVVVCLCAHERV